MQGLVSCSKPSKVWQGSSSHQTMQDRVLIETRLSSEQPWFADLRFGSGFIPVFIASVTASYPISTPFFFLLGASHILMRSSFAKVREVLQAADLDTVSNWCTAPIAGSGTCTLQPRPFDFRCRAWVYIWSLARKKNGKVAKWRAKDTQRNFWLINYSLTC